MSGYYYYYYYVNAVSLSVTLDWSMNTRPTPRSQKVIKKDLIYAFEL